jgi:hypothetical protein
MRKPIFYIIAFAYIIYFSTQALAVGLSDPLVLTYSGGTGAGNSTSKFSENIWEYKYQYHVFMLSGDVPQGKLFSQIQVEERDGMSGLAYARLALTGSNYELEVGDNVANFSELTLYNVAYQGAGVTLKPLRTWSLTVVGGSKGNGIWGSDVRRDTRSKESFTGLRTVFYPGSGLGFNATYLTTPGGKDVFAYGTEYALGDASFAAEYGSAMEGKAFRGEVKYQTPWLTLGSIYRDIDETYIVPIDYMSYQGKKGTYSTLALRPNNALSVNVQTDSYLDRFNSTEEVYNVDMRGDVMFNVTPSTNLGYSGWKNDRSQYDRGGVTEGEMMYITQQFQLITKNAIYYRVQPTWYESNIKGVSDESYSEKKNITGLNITLFEMTHLNYEIENTTKFLKNSDISVNPTAITSRMDIFESQVFSTPFYLSSAYNYRVDVPDQGLERLSTTSTYTEITLKYIPSQDLNCYVTTKTTNITSPDDDRSAREQKDLSFGLTYSFNTFIYLK